MTAKVWELISSDYYRYYGECPKKYSLVFLQRLVINPALRFTFWLRLASEPSHIRPFAKFFKTLMARKYGLAISERMKIGFGFHLLHPYGVIINPSAEIGNNVTICQFTTIGAMDGRAAVIGDMVYIGPGVCIVENVRIGTGSTVGAGSVVVRDVEDGSTVAGNPAKVVSAKISGRYISNPWNIHTNGKI